MNTKRTLTSINISNLAFWDVDPSKIDIEKDSLFVMGKVFNYGSWSDIVSVLNYYGLERIKKEIVHAPYLKKTALSFLSLITGLKKDAFLAIKRRNRNKSLIWKD